ncbi:aminopeptidase P N-terminal domain-containing protein [Acholeplasma equirhinis]|uniref:aminopeptidase P family protein n=1 Tax=Acholeplasma equirhinis TaxID=555393 RepID=UPI00197AF10E|nr:aminopeptidase P family protein [Acholeplasma equirhinis]MBN3490515.1 aminopeptidase P N-terminal domain-containing protein [Acholeplasma equirhinis]
MLLQRRTNYFNKVEAQSISLFYSGRAPHLSADAYYTFTVNKNFWYLSGIDQENAVLVMVKSQKTTDTYLFIKAIDPVEALWVGESLSFEKAAQMAELPVENVKDIQTLNTFLSGLLSATRRAIFGTLTTVYFDMERMSMDDEPLMGERQAKLFMEKYPFMKLLNSHGFLTDLRGSKDKYELEAIKGAIAVSVKAHSHLLDSLKKVETEYELEAEFNYILNRNHSKPAFGSIVAGGKNATILHYEHNNMPLQKGDLVLLDLGARKDYYASDITRTYPINGKFTKRQREIYQAVLNVNKAIISWAKAGITQMEYNQKGKELLALEAKKIGLIKDDSELGKYYYHSLGHALGLDVHDVTDPQVAFKVGQVITVEPGLYVAEEGIGVRIEDNIVLTETGAINLSAEIIKEVDEIEKYMAK